MVEVARLQELGSSSIPDRGTKRPSDDVTEAANAKSGEGEPVGARVSQEECWKRAAPPGTKETIRSLVFERIERTHRHLGQAGIVAAKVSTLLAIRRAEWINEFLTLEGKEMIEKFIRRHQAKLNEPPASRAMVYMLGVSEPQAGADGADEATDRRAKRSAQGGGDESGAPAARPRIPSLGGEDRGFLAEWLRDYDLADRELGQHDAGGSGVAINAVYVGDGRSGETSQTAGEATIGFAGAAVREPAPKPIDRPEGRAGAPAKSQIDEEDINMMIDKLEGIAGDVSISFSKKELLKREVGNAVNEMGMKNLVRRTALANGSLRTDGGVLPQASNKFAYIRGPHFQKLANLARTMADEQNRDPGLWAKSGNNVTSLKSELSHVVMCVAGILSEMPLRDGTMRLENRLRQFVELEPTTLALGGAPDNARHRIETPGLQSLIIAVPAVEGVGDTMVMPVLKMNGAVLTVINGAPPEAYLAITDTFCAKLVFTEGGLPAIWMSKTGDGLYRPAAASDWGARMVVVDGAASVAVASKSDMWVVQNDTKVVETALGATKAAVSGIVVFQFPVLDEIDLRRGWGKLVDKVASAQTVRREREERGASGPVMSGGGSSDLSERSSETAMGGAPSEEKGHIKNLVDWATLTVEGGVTAGHTEMLIARVIANRKPDTEEAANFLAEFLELVRNPDSWRLRAGELRRLESKARNCGLRGYTIIINIALGKISEAVRVKDEEAWAWHAKFKPGTSFERAGAKVTVAIKAMGLAAKGWHMKRDVRATMEALTELSSQAIQENHTVVACAIAMYNVGEHVSGVQPCECGGAEDGIYIVLGQEYTHGPLNFSVALGSGLGYDGDAKFCPIFGTVLVDHRESFGQDIASYMADLGIRHLFERDRKFELQPGWVKACEDEEMKAYLTISSGIIVMVFMDITVKTHTVSIVRQIREAYLRARPRELSAAEIADITLLQLQRPFL